MLCQNCGEKQANVKYTQIVNGVKKEMILCQECANQLGIGSNSFQMPMNLSSFFGDLLEGYEDASFLPNFPTSKQITCEQCGLTYDDFITNGKFGCSHCYDVFSPKIDPILKNIQGSSTHVGRNGRIARKQVERANKEQTSSKHEAKPKDPLQNLKSQLKEAIQQERYEDAAKLRDQIKELEK